MRTLNFSTKQKGYGRKGLYFEFDGNSYHIADVFPNVKENFNIELREDCFFDEEKEEWTNSNGNEVIPVDSIDEFIFENYKEKIGQILFENLDFENYDLDFENSTYEEIANWAISY